MKKQNKKCPCGNGHSVEKCCLPVILGETKAQSPEQLMRSRYTAYVKGCAAYILSSWHSSTRPAELTLEANPDWSGLKIVNASDTKNGQCDEAYVEFIAGFMDNGVPGVLQERSRFILEQGEWRYVDGEQIEVSESRFIKKHGRNDLCSCGSGRKFKRCCG